MWPPVLHRGRPWVASIRMRKWPLETASMASWGQPCAASMRLRRRRLGAASLASWGWHSATSMRPDGWLLVGTTSIYWRTFLWLVYLLFGYIFVEYHFLDEVVIWMVGTLLTKFSFGPLLISWWIFHSNHYRPSPLLGEAEEAFGGLLVMGLES